jgi:hypothetical protein
MINAIYQLGGESNLRRSTASSDSFGMTAVIVFLLVLGAIGASLFWGRDSRVLEDERGWWPAYRRDRVDG